MTNESEKAVFLARSQCNLTGKSRMTFDHDERKKKRKKGELGGTWREFGNSARVEDIFMTENRGVGRWTRGWWRWWWRDLKTKCDMGFAWRVLHAQTRRRSTRWNFYSSTAWPPRSYSIEINAQTFVFLSCFFFLQIHLNIFFLFFLA